MFCQKCGKETAENQAFCANCGAPIGKVEAGQETPATKRESPVRQSILARLPLIVRDEVPKLPLMQQQAFLEEFRRRSKNVAVAYILWFLLGCHYAYLGRWPLQLLYWVTLGGFLIWALIDLGRIPTMVMNKNNDVALAVLKDLKAVSAK